MTDPRPPGPVPHDPVPDDPVPDDPAADHLDADTVADLIENLLPAAAARRARSHVRACPACQQTYDSLVELSRDLAQDGRLHIPMPADVAEHLDSVIRSESVLRESTVGVHSLAALRAEPSRRLSPLMLAAAAALVVGIAGVALVVALSIGRGGSAAELRPTKPAGIGSTALPVLTTSQLGSEVQRLLEGSSGTVMLGSAAEHGCAAEFARREPARTLRLVLPAMVEDRRTTVIGLQSTATRDVRILVLTDCDSGSPSAADAHVVYDTTITLRNR